MGTSFQVLFLMRALYSACSAFFHLGSDNASLVVEGSRLLWADKKALGLKTPAFALVIMLWVGIIGLDFWDVEYGIVWDGNVFDEVCKFCKVDGIIV